MKRFLLLLALSACSTCPAPEEVAVKHWSREEQLEILAEEKKLPNDSILIPVLEDYARLRRENK